MKDLCENGVFVAYVLSWRPRRHVHRLAHLCRVAGCVRHVQGVQSRRRRAGVLRGGPVR